MILLGIGPHTFAIPASAVDEIREHLDLKAFRPPNTTAKVRHTMVKNGRTYFVVDSSFYLRLLPSKASRILVLRDGPVAFTADRIDRMFEVQNVWGLPLAFQGEERRWYRGIAVVDGNVVPVLDPESFVSTEELAQLNGAANGASA